MWPSLCGSRWCVDPGLPGPLRAVTDRASTMLSQPALYGLSLFTFSFGARRAIDTRLGGSSDPTAPRRLRPQERARLRLEGRLGAASRTTFLDGGARAQCRSSDDTVRPHLCRAAEPERDGVRRAGPRGWQEQCRTRMAERMARGKVLGGATCLARRVLVPRHRLHTQPLCVLVT